MGSLDMKLRKDDCCLLNSPDLSPGLTQSVIVAFASCIPLFSQSTMKPENRRTRIEKREPLRTDIVEKRGAFRTVGMKFDCGVG